MIDLLPKYSPWPARLLGLTPWEGKKKTRAEVLREFDREKWGTLHARYEEALRAGHAATLDEIESWDIGGPTSRELLVATKVGLELITVKAARDRYVELLAREIETYEGSTLVELGCGYGAVLLRLLQRPALAGRSAVGLDLTTFGPRLLSLIGKAMGVSVSVGFCDLASTPVTDAQLPPQTVIYTSYAAHYIPQVAPAFVENLLSLQPRAVIHFEPCFEHFDETSLLGLLRRRYVQVNDYTTNFLTVLRAAEKERKITIVKEEPTVFGANPLLPVSAIVWQPT